MTEDTETHALFVIEKMNEFLTNVELPVGQKVFDPANERDKVSRQKYNDLTKRERWQNQLEEKLAAPDLPPQDAERIRATLE